MHLLHHKPLEVVMLRLRGFFFVSTSPQTRIPRSDKRTFAQLMKTANQKHFNNGKLKGKATAYLRGKTTATPLHQTPQHPNSLVRQAGFRCNKSISGRKNLLLIGGFCLCLCLCACEPSFNGFEGIEKGLDPGLICDRTGRMFVKGKKKVKVRDGTFTFYFL